MVDIFALALSHGLLAIAVWRLLARADLDDDHPQPRRRIGQKRAAGDGAGTEGAGRDA